jgi:DNA processing protein
MQPVNEEKLYTLAFSFIPSIGPARFEMMKVFFDSLKNAWEASETQLLKSGIGAKSAKSIIENRNKISPEKKFEELRKLGISFITKNDKAYPEILKEISSPPFILFYLGNLKALKQKMIAIVGPRMPTHYGKNVTTKFATELATSGIIIVSGMAKGIDSISHKACVDIEKPTIAVLGCGIEISRQNTENRKQINSIIATGGLILSEYPPLTKSAKYTFPARNRIVSGLSLGTLIPEAGLRSGTLITARLSLEENREVFAVPGNIFSEKSAGTNWLLKNGAVVVDSLGDIFETLKFIYTPKDKEKETEHSFSDKVEEEIYALLSIEPLHIDILARKGKIDHATLLSKLSLFELSGIAQNVGGGMFIRR